MDSEMMPLIVQISAAIAAALGVWGVMSLVNARAKTPGDDRLNRMLEAAQARAPNTAARAARERNEQLQKRLTEIATKFGEASKPTSEEEIGKLKLELLNAGFRGNNAVAAFLGIKLLCFLVAAAIAVPLAYSSHGFSQTGLIYMLGGSAVGLYLPGIVVAVLRKRRQESIFLGMPDALDLLVVCVEAGLGLDAAMRRVASELAASSPVLCEELAIANFQIQVGRPRKDVLRDLGVRTGVADLRALAAVLIQAERFGSSIASALRVQSEAMRVKRKQLAEERAAKTAVKLLFPLVLFIFPGIFVVLVGPAAIVIKQKLVDGK